MSAVCPTCHKAIASADVNINTDVAICRPCNQSYSFAAIDDREPWPASVDVQTPPPGVTYTNDGDRITITAKGSPGFFGYFLLAFACMWNVMVVSTGASSVATGAAGLGDLPHIIAGFGLMVAAVMVVFGRHHVLVSKDELVLKYGVGPLAYWRTYKRAAITGVSPQSQRDRRTDGYHTSIRVDGPDARFGSTLPSSSRAFVGALLRQTLRVLP